MSDTHKYLEKFLKNIRNEYEKARTAAVGEEKNIFRGRSRCISAIAEDLFAELISHCVGSDLYYFIDQPIKCEMTDKKKIHCPDLLVCKKNAENEYSIRCILDLKMDVGWFRNSISDVLQKLADAASDMKHADELSGKDGKDKDKDLIFKTCSDLYYAMVTVTAKNSGKKDKATELCDMSGKDDNVWVLSSGDHPNSYDESVNFECRYDDFDKLIKKIKECTRK